MNERELFLSALEIDATEYRAQVLQATGDITTDILKPSVIAGLLADWWDATLAAIAESAPGLLFNLFLFFVVVFIARKLSRVAERVVEHSLSKSQFKLLICSGVSIPVDWLQWVPIPIMLVNTHLLSITKARSTVFTLSPLHWPTAW